MKLSKRLLAIADYINDKDKVVDVGCDHGYLDIYLALYKKNELIIASDISSNVIKNTKDNIKNYGIEDKIKVYCTNGLENIKEDYDTVVLSGMGAYTIIEILKKAHNVNKIIIQSNNNWETIRYSLKKIGYNISSEKLVYEKNKLYSIMVFEKKKAQLNSKTKLVGLYNKSNTEEYKIWINNINNVLKLIPKKHFLKRLKYKKQLKFLNEFLTKENRAVI